jgi:hypothetical protein
MTYFCSECKKPCREVKRDFGIGAYEYWGQSGSDHNWQWVSHCCDGDLLDEIEEDEEVGED